MAYREKQCRSVFTTCVPYASDPFKRIGKFSTMHAILILSIWPTMQKKFYFTDSQRARQFHSQPFESRGNCVTNKKLQSRMPRCHLLYSQLGHAFHCNNPITWSQHHNTVHVRYKWFRTWMLWRKLILSKNPIKHYSLVDSITLLTGFSDEQTTVANNLSFVCRLCK